MPNHNSQNPYKNMSIQEVLNGIEIIKKSESAESTIYSFKKKIPRDINK